MIKTGIIYILFCTCNLILGYTEGGAAWWVDYRKDARECRSLCECPGATLDQALTEVCLPSLRWAPPTATPGALRVLFAHRRKPLRLHRILTAQDLRPTRGAVEGSSGTSALGNEAEQAQDHRARTEDSGLPPHQHVWWGSWHLKGKWNFSLFSETVCSARCQLIFRVLWLQERRRPVFQSPGLRGLT